MTKWQNFLDSLAMKGGNILLLVLLSSGFLITAIFLMLKFGPTVPAVTLIVGAFNSFSGALLMALVGKDKNGGTPPTPPVAPAA